MSWRISATLAYIFSFSTAYAAFERYGNPCSLLPWCGYQWNGLALYQYAFMLPLFTLVALVPVLYDIPMSGAADLQAFGSFLLAVLAEDTIYFLIEMRPISPGIYTTQWGYLIIAGFALPFWYFFFGAGVVLAFHYARNWPSAGLPRLSKRAPSLSPIAQIPYLAKAKQRRRSRKA